MTRYLLILSIFLVGFLTNQFTPKRAPPPKSVEISKEATSSGTQVASGSATARVVRVIDGDTIEIEGGKKVRYIGIDTPETSDPRRPVMCFGHEASQENKKLVEGKDVRLEKDVSETDKYGRLLRYVYAGGVFVNDHLVRRGFAHALTYPPDVKFAGQFIGAQREARENKRGLWRSCP